jgi:hypothetical protein
VTTKEIKNSLTKDILNAKKMVIILGKLNINIIPKLENSMEKLVQIADGINIQKYCKYII